jgi:hypothetical protein
MFAMEVSEALALEHLILMSLLRFGIINILSFRISGAIIFLLMLLRLIHPMFY